MADLVKYSQELMRARIAIPTSMMAVTSAWAAWGLSTRIVSLLTWWTYLETTTSRMVYQNNIDINIYHKLNQQELIHKKNFYNFLHVLTNISTLLNESGAYAITVTHKLTTSIIVSLSGSFS